MIKNKYYIGQEVVDISGRQAVIINIKRAKPFPDRVEYTLEYKDRTTLDLVDKVFRGLDENK